MTNQSLGNASAAPLAILKCVDCGSPSLEHLDAGARCTTCGRVFLSEAGILLMLPIKMETLRVKEMDARDQNAEKYDEQRPSDYTRLLDHFSIDHRVFSAGDAVLDVGCGTGRSTVKLGGRVGEIFALDFSLQSLKIAKAKYEASGARAKATFIQADANSLPFHGSGRFKFINALDFIQHIPGFCARERLLGDLHRLLASGGSLSLTAYHFSKGKRGSELIRKTPQPGEGGKQGYHRGGFYYYNFHLEEAVAMVSQAGFEIEGQGLFYFSLPRPFAILKRVTGMDRIRFEARYRRFLEDYGERLFIHAVK